MKISWIRKSSQTVFTLIILFIGSFVYAQDVELIEEDVQEESFDGEKLFKQNCASCHNPVKNSTGPKLQGAKQKWIDNGEGELIYEWVKNPAALKNSGRSKMANKIWDYDPSVMTPQNLSRNEIDAVFAYVDAYTAPVAAAGPMSGTESGSSSESNYAYWWWIVAGLLVIVIFSTLGSRRQLAHLVAKQEGKEIEPNKSIGQNVREWCLRNWLVTVLILVVLLITGGVELFNRLYQVGVFEDYQPSQPIAYSHKLHAGNLGIECKYCHHSVEKSKHAGIPSQNVCMNCHKVVHEGPVTGTKEIAKIHKAVGYNVDIKDYNRDDNGNVIEGNPIVWNKAHNLPDHVFFSHAQHVHPNTGNIDCRQCHGHVETYTLGRVSTIDEVNAFAKTDEGKERGIIELTKPLLTMGWCIECHNKKEIDLKSTDYYVEMHNRLKNRPDVMRNIYKDKKVTVREMGGWECAKCHY